MVRGDTNSTVSVPRGVCQTGEWRGRGGGDRWGVRAKREKNNDRGKIRERNSLKREIKTPMKITQN